MVSTPYTDDPTESRPMSQISTSNRPVRSGPPASAASITGLVLAAVVVLYAPLVWLDRIAEELDDSISSTAGMPLALSVAIPVVLAASLASSVLGLRHERRTAGRASTVGILAIFVAAFAAVVWAGTLSVAW